ncbi:hypothetical protein ACOMHN_055627 [Nucella lapillus]
MKQLVRRSAETLLLLFLHLCLAGKPRDSAILSRQEVLDILLVNSTYNARISPDYEQEQAVAGSSQHY